MFAQALISFRESFEAAILVVIVVLYLKRINKSYLIPYVILGSFIGIILSIITGISAHMLYFIAEIKEVAEAVASFVAVLVLTSVIYWMTIKGKGIKQSVEMKTEEAVRKGSLISMVSLGFIFVFREGFETVLFTLPLIFSQPVETTSGVSIGIIPSLVLAYLIFKGALKIRLKTFFFVTSILIVLIASGILGYGVHELIEYWEETGYSLGVWDEPIYELPFSEDNPLHDEGIVGSLLAIFIGYTTKMELLRFVLQFTYLVIGLSLIIYATKK